MAGILDLGRLSSKYYSAYRPIIAEYVDNDSDTAFLRARLDIGDTALGGTYSSTGIIINAYERPNLYGSTDRTFEFNLMEYCRNFISPGICPVLSLPTYQLPGHFETAKFKLKVWAVKYSQTTVGGLYDDDDNYIRSNSFVAVGTVTEETDGLSHFDDFTNINRFVVGKNSPYTEADTAMPLTDKPVPWGSLIAETDNNNGLYTINIDDFACDSVYSPVAFDKDRDSVAFAFVDIPISGGTSSLKMIHLPQFEMNQRVPFSPEWIEYTYLIQNGTPLNTLIDASGNLISKGLVGMLLLYSSGGGGGFTTPWEAVAPYNGNIEWRWEWVKYSDEKNNGHCQRTKFVFKNMRGGFDFFNAHGTQEKEVAMGGTQFDNHVVEHTRGYHGRKQLWTTREDVFSVFSQPLKKDEAEWLQQLITSPQVWVQREVKHTDDLYSRIGGQKNFLQPVIIDKGSYKIHNTEDNVHFIEFKYRYSNPTTTQKG